MRFSAGAVEFSTANESSQAIARLYAAPVRTFVGEIEVTSKVDPPTDIYFQWHIKACASQGGVALTFWPATETIRIQENLPGGTFTFLTNDLPAAVRRGAVVAVVVETTRITVYSDQRQLAQIEHTRCGGDPLTPQLSIGAGKGGGSVRITGLRMYALP